MWSIILYLNYFIESKNNPNFQGFVLIRAVLFFVHATLKFLQTKQTNCSNHAKLDSNELLIRKWVSHDYEIGWTSSANLKKIALLLLKD